MAYFKPENVEDFYEIGDLLGSGHFGQVRQVRDRSSGTSWAGKFLKIRKSPCSMLGVERSGVEREVEILHAVQHPNIAALRDVFESRAEVVLILELVGGGELFDFIAEKENLLETEAIEFLKQILQALSFMHGRNIAHFDLKPENLMLSDKSAPHPRIKLIDFGLAHHFCPGEEFRSTSGTPQYIDMSRAGAMIPVNPLAPEVINFEPLSAAADMWSIGVITFVLLSGLSPFQDDTDEETLRNVISVKFEFDDRVFSTTSSMAKSFIQKLLLKEPHERMTAEECLLHPWIKTITSAQATKRNRSSINMKNFKKFNARRKWKASYNTVRVCNRLIRLQVLNKSSEQDPLQRECESDSEDTESKTMSLLRRRLSSSS